EGRRASGGCAGPARDDLLRHRHRPDEAKHVQREPADPRRRSFGQGDHRGARVKAVVAVLVALVLAAPVRADQTDLLFPDGEKYARLRIEVSDGGKSPEVAWTAFLDKLFTHFDRDHDGSLSEAEAKRVFPLPLPSGKVVAPDFAALDADRDGK